MFPHASAVHGQNSFLQDFLPFPSRMTDSRGHATDIARLCRKQNTILKELSNPLPSETQENISETHTNFKQNNERGEKRNLFQVKSIGLVSNIEKPVCREIRGSPLLRYPILTAYADRLRMNTYHTPEKTL